MLQLGNSKLGPKVYTWSLPVIKTCPGASEACLAMCYAQTGFLAYPSVKLSYTRNLAASRRQDFVDRMSFHIREQLVENLRLHVSGDFYSNAYIDKWREIMQRNPAVKFLAYSRSWNTEDLRQNLLRLGREPNLALWMSYDRSMPAPPRTKLPICYLSADDTDLPRRRVDLVFRNKRKTVMKRTPGGAVVCPHENGVTKTSCSQCTLCWNKAPSLVQLALATT